VSARVAGRVGGLLLAMAVVAACAAAEVSGPAPSVVVSATPEPARTPSALPVAVGPQPPNALLRATGVGADVVGGLGGFTWRGVGSDAPWLPGAPASAGPGAILSVGFDRVVPLASWSALIAPAADASGASAAPAGSGSGPITITAPKPGAWTLALQVVFGDGLGDAAYYWRLEVR
jgi:hypothetical protein